MVPAWAQPMSKKDVIGLVFSQRLRAQARQKQIDPAKTREGWSGRGRSPQ